MKIAMIVDSFPAISEKFLINQFYGLVQQGAEIDIYAAVPAKQTNVHKIYEESGLSKRLINLNIPLSPVKRLLHLPVLFLKNFFRSPGKTLRAFSKKRYSTAAKNLKNLFFLNALFDKRYDIIHCQFGNNGLTGAFLKDCGVSNNLVVTFHGYDIIVAPEVHGRRMYEYMFSRCDSVTVGTRFMKAQVMRYGCPNEIIDIIPMGVFVPSRTETPKENFFLSVGRLVEFKGFLYAIEAFAKLPKNFEHIKYFIVGKGPLYESLQNKIQALGCGERILLLGEKRDFEVAELYQKALVFIAPSIQAADGAVEGQGLVIQEAESYGLPVIASDSGGIPDGIVDGKTGFLCPEKDADTLSEKMLFFLENPERIGEFGQAGRKLVEEKYDVMVLSRKIIDEVYKKLAANAGSQ